MKTARRSEASKWGLIAAGALVVWVPVASRAINTVTPDLTAASQDTPVVQNAPAAGFSAGVGDILKMVDAKVDPEVIKTYINNSPTAYNPSATEIIALIIVQRSGRVLLRAIDTPPSSWDSPLAVFQASYKHEQHVTSLINNLVSLSFSESDFATNSFLQWFVNEQVEEEANADAIVHDLKRVGRSTDGVFLMDRELATRQFTPPAAGAEAGE